MAMKNSGWGRARTIAGVVPEAISGVQRATPVRIVRSLPRKPSAKAAIKLVGEWKPFQHLQTPPKKICCKENPERHFHQLYDQLVFAHREPSFARHMHHLQRKAPHAAMYRDRFVG